MAEQFHEKVRFRELRRPLLTNPHKGCATFQRFNGDPLNQGARWSEEGPLAFPPADREVADAQLYAGLVHPQTRQPRVRFAVEESDAQGWVPIGIVKIDA